jgi:intracellular multiplication protein IcmL
MNAENDALVLVFSRNMFYKRLYHLALAALILCILVIALLASILVYLLRNPTHPLYFAADDVGRLIQIVPVNTPNMSTDDVSAWAVEAVQAAYSYDYINYHAQIQNAQKYFTNYGWQQYMSALTLSNNLLALTTRKQVVIARVISQPTVLKTGILAGKYAWQFQMPLLVTYSEPPYDDKSQFSNALNVTVIVQRQSVLEGYKGLGVVQLVSSIATSENSQTQQISGTSTG